MNEGWTDPEIYTMDDIIRVPIKLRDEQGVAHELLHLKVPNHGKVFRALLKAYLAESR